MSELGYRKIEVLALKPDFEPLGPINQMTAIRWTERAFSVGDYELWCPLTDENAMLLQQDNLLWIGEDACGVVEVVQKIKDADGKLSLQVSGRFNECWLERRVILTDYTGTEYASTHIKTLVNSNCINPTDSKRKIPNLYLIDDEESSGPKETYKTEKGNLFTRIFGIAADKNIVVRFKNDVRNKKVYFSAMERVDRSINQDEVIPVVLSSDLSDVLSSDYQMDLSAWYNTAHILGANNRNTILNDDNTGLGRREILVDATDTIDRETWTGTVTTEVTYVKEYTLIHLNNRPPEQRWRVYQTITRKEKNNVTQEEINSVINESYVSKVPVEVGKTVENISYDDVYPDSKYNSMLANIGGPELEKYPKVEAFTSQVRVTGARAYTYGKDYFLGDRVTVRDTELKIELSTEITAVERTWDENSYSVILSLGNTAPTITELVKREDK